MTAIQFMTIADAKNFANMGVVLEWRAPKDECNGGYYHGKDVILAVNENERKPLITKCIEGDDLSFAITEAFKLIKCENGYRATKAETTDDYQLTYSDEYREVEIINVIKQ